jgi:hypothetical protein
MMYDGATETSQCARTNAQWAVRTLRKTRPYLLSINPLKPEQSGKGGGEREGEGKCRRTMRETTFLRTHRKFPTVAPRELSLTKPSKGLWVHQTPYSPNAGDCFRGCKVVGP